MRHFVLLLAFGLSSSVVARTPPVSLFTTLGLTSEEMAAVDAGRPVAKVLQLSRGGCGDAKNAKDFFKLRASA